MQNPEDSTYRKWFLTELHKRITPHSKQIEVIRALEEGHDAKVDCGRKFGKTMTAIYVAARWAGLRQNQNIYIVAPKLKQVREIYFDSRAMDRVIPEDALEDRFKSEGRFLFKTGSFIKVDGADNPDMQRGFDVDLLINDESKDTPVDFWDSMALNLIARGGKLLILGTPPDNDEEPSAKKYLELTREFAKHDRKRYFTGSSYDNPHTDHRLIDEEVRRLRELGQEDVVQREIYGVYVPGGRQLIFPVFDNPKLGTKNVYDDVPLELEWRNQAFANQLEFWCVADPGTAKCFAAAIIAFNRETGFIYVITSFGEKSMAQNSTGQIMERIFLLCSQFGPRLEKWRFLYDEAGLWFYNECVAQKINPGWEATQKNLWKTATDDVKPGISMLRDVMRRGLLKVGKERNDEMIRQVKAYAKDKKGNIPKKNDDLIDILRYFVMSSGYEPPPEAMSQQIPHTQQPMDKKLLTQVSLDVEINSEMHFENYLFEEYDSWEY